MHALRPTLLCLAFAVAAATGQLTFTAEAAAPVGGVTVCSQAGDRVSACAAAAGDALSVTLPAGARQCPASEAGTACATGTPAERGSGTVGVTLTATQSVVGPGKPATLTATSTVPVEQVGYVIEMFDAGRNVAVTYCSRGTACSAAVTQPVSGSRAFVAGVGKLSTSASSPDMVAVSDQLSVTWLSVDLGSTPNGLGGGVHLEATTNADLTSTPWSIGILDDRGRLVGAPCKTGTGCGADLTVSVGSTATFTGVVGAVAQPNEDTLSGSAEKEAGRTTFVDVQAQSRAVGPTRLLWGVDSCKAITGDATGEVYPGVAGGLGTPDFWGRYLTQTRCPGLSSSEIALAHNQHMGILAIYDDYDCSTVAGYDTGYRYGVAATGAATGLGIPTGRAIAIDIEPPGPDCPGAANVDPGFIQGWYDSVSAAHYAPAYYGNGTAGSEFATAWCSAVSPDTGRPEIASNSYLWSFEPSLINAGNRGNAPGFGPNLTGCAGNSVAWQYQLGYDGPNPDVDLDEALSTLPLWYP